MPPELQEAAASRREALAAGGVVLAGLFSAAPAQAFLGFGEGEAREAAYKDETVSGREGGLKLHTGHSAFIARALHTSIWQQQCGRRRGAILSQHLCLCLPAGLHPGQGEHCAGPGQGRPSKGGQRQGGEAHT